MCLSEVLRVPSFVDTAFSFKLEKDGAIALHHQTSISSADKERLSTDD